LSIHNGHRERMRQRIKKETMENFAPHEVLEVLLYYCIPREDTNPIAHALIKRYKTVARVLEASPLELQQFDGIGEGAAFFLSMLNQANRYINIERSTKDCTKSLLSISDYSKYLIDLFDGLANEAAYILCLDAKGVPLGHFKIGEGDMISTPISMRKVTEVVMTSNAAAVILAHNHPNGLTLPSDDDIVVTNNLAAFLRDLNVCLIDHIIVSGKDYLSVTQCSKMRF